MRLYNRKINCFWGVLLVLAVSVGLYFGYIAKIPSKDIVVLSWNTIDKDGWLDVEIFVRGREFIMCEYQNNDIGNTKFYKGELTTDKQLSLLYYCCSLSSDLEPPFIPGEIAVTRWKLSGNTSMEAREAYFSDRDGELSIRLGELYKKMRKNEFLVSKKNIPDWIVNNSFIQTRYSFLSWNDPNHMGQ